MDKKLFIDALTTQKNYLIREMDKAQPGFNKGYYDGRAEQCQRAIDALNASEDDFLGALIDD